MCVQWVVTQQLLNNTAPPTDVRWLNRTKCFFSSPTLSWDRYHTHIYFSMLPVTFNSPLIHRIFKKSSVSSQKYRMSFLSYLLIYRLFTFYLKIIIFEDIFFDLYVVTEKYQTRMVSQSLWLCFINTRCRSLYSTHHQKRKQ